MKGIVRYSKKIPGERGNYGWPVRYDRIDSFVGITQFETDGEVKDRVLLSSNQIKALLDFVKKR